MRFGNGAVLIAAVFSLTVAGCGSIEIPSAGSSGAPVRALGQVGGEPRVIRSLAATDEAALAELASPPLVAAATTTTVLAAPTTTESARPRGTIVAHATAEEITAYVAADDTSEAIEVFANPTSRNGPLVFQAVGTEQGEWIEVLLPIRPNGTTGWIKTTEVDLTLNPYLIEVDASAYELRIFRFGTLELSTPIALGTGDTPTPIGQFYLIELLKPTNPNGAYGSYAYGLSGYSETLDSFNGGEGVIGIHGTNQPELLGQDVSHGCIRVANPEIERMVAFLPLGTPVHISR